MTYSCYNWKFVPFDPSTHFAHPPPSASGNHHVVLSINDLLLGCVLLSDVLSWRRIKSMRCTLYWTPIVSGILRYDFPFEVSTISTRRWGNRLQELKQLILHTAYNDGSKWGGNFPIAEYQNPWLLPMEISIKSSCWCPFPTPHLRLHYHQTLPGTSGSFFLPLPAHRVLPPSLVHAPLCRWAVSSIAALSNRSFFKPGNVLHLYLSYICV